MNKSHLTAIARKVQPVPVRWLVEHHRIQFPVLDYGCGKCFSVNPFPWINYDPHWYKINLDSFRGSFQTVVCTYVMCVLRPKERRAVLRDIQTLLRPEGTAYITLNKRRPKWGWGEHPRGTYQGRGTNLWLPEVYSNSNFRILKMMKDDKI